MVEEAAGNERAVAEVVTVSNTVETCGGRSDRGRGRGNLKSYINNVDVTDPHRNFSSEEWDKLGSMRSIVLQMRTNSGRGSRDGRGGGRTQVSGDGQRNASSTSTINANVETATANQQSGDHSTVVSDITKQGSQNGQVFGRGAYT